MSFVLHTQMGAGGNLVGACAFVSEKIQYNFQNRSPFTLPSPVLVEGLKMQEKIMLWFGKAIWSLHTVAFTGGFTKLLCFLEQKRKKE